MDTAEATTHADWQNLSMPSITGYLAPTLTVTNLARSVTWYREVLDLTIRREYEPPDKRQRDACLLVLSRVTHCDLRDL